MFVRYPNSWANALIDSRSFWSSAISWCKIANLPPLEVLSLSSISLYSILVIFSIPFFTYLNNKLLTSTHHLSQSAHPFFCSIDPSFRWVIHKQAHSSTNNEPWKPRQFYWSDAFGYCEVRKQYTVGMMAARIFRRTKCSFPCGTGKVLMHNSINYDSSRLKRNWVATGLKKDRSWL